MCWPGLVAAIGGAGATAGAATAAGATAGAAAGAATIGGTLQTIGTVIGIGASLYSGISQMQAYNAQADALEQQAQTNQQIAAVEDERTRRQYRSAMRQQTAELAARGIQLDSPTALMLGESAARELSFASQSVRSGASARTAELTATQRSMRARGRLAGLSGGLSAVTGVLDAAPDIWPGLNETRQLS